MVLNMAQCCAGFLSSKKRVRHVKSPFDESQTEYVKIPSAVKRPCTGVMTDRQKEVLARQKAGKSAIPQRLVIVHEGHMIIAFLAKACNANIHIHRDHGCLLLLLLLLLLLSLYNPHCTAKPHTCPASACSKCGFMPHCSSRL